MKAKTNLGLFSAALLFIFAIFSSKGKKETIGMLKLKRISPEEVEKNRCKQYEYAA